MDIPWNGGIRRAGRLLAASNGNPPVRKSECQGIPDQAGQFRKASKPPGARGLHRLQTGKRIPETNRHEQRHVELIFQADTGSGKLFLCRQGFERRSSLRMMIRKNYGGQRLGCTRYPQSGKTTPRLLHVRRHPRSAIQFAARAASSELQSTERRNAVAVESRPNPCLGKQAILDGVERQRRVEFLAKRSPGSSSKGAVLRPNSDLPRLACGCRYSFCSSSSAGCPVQASPCWQGETRPDSIPQHLWN